MEQLQCPLVWGYRENGDAWSFGKVIEDFRNFIADVLSNAVDLGKRLVGGVTKWNLEDLCAPRVGFDGGGIHRGSRRSGVERMIWRI